jgi:hypothetical protein
MIRALLFVLVLEVLALGGACARWVKQGWPKGGPSWD